MHKTTATFAAITLALSLGQGTAAAADGAAHLHMGHVSEHWTDTPEGKGLLPTATAEAKIARQHAAAIIKKMDDLDWMQLHTHHVLHALDAGLEKQGPGLGYGVAKAAAGAAQHIEAAANSADASVNVKTHSIHVATTARNTIGRVEEIVATARQILAATTASEANSAAQKLHRLSEALLDGEDADGNGKITWHQGEGGLLEAEKHMNIMRKGEGL